MRVASRPAAALVLVVAAVVAVLLGRAALLALMLVLGMLAGGDVFRRARARGAQPVALLGLAAIAAFMVVAHLLGTDALRVFPVVVAGSLVAAFVGMLARRGRRSVMHGLVYTMLAVLVVGLFGAYVLVLRAERNGFRLVLGLAVMTILAELASWAAPALRRRALVPLERFVFAGAGALLGAVALAIALPSPFGWGRALVLGLLVGVAVPAGDMIGILLEHDLEPDDRRQGPSSEGVLAHVDGLLLAAPLFFYAFRVMAR